MGKRVLHAAVLLVAAAGALVLPPSTHTQTAPQGRRGGSSSSLTALEREAIKPVPSLEPVATQRLWRRLVNRKQPLAATIG